MALDLELVILDWGFLWRSINLNATTATENRDIVVFSGHLWVINEVAMVSWRKLSPDRILNREPIFLHLVECCLRQPSRSVYLEWVRILARLQVLSVRELYYNLFNRDDLFDFLMIVLD